MKILCLFDGMGCGRLACENLGIPVTKYYSSEIDNHANKVTKTKWSDVIQLGDVTKWRELDIDWSKVDLILAGSPCQGFSFAGKQLAFDDPRSALFFEFVDILRYCQSLNPNVHYLLENVRMKQEYENVISRLLNVKPLIINSALVSAQNRVRLYWTSINQKSFGLFGDKYIDIPQPEDLGILLKDILESEVDEKYYLSEKMNTWLTNHSIKRGTEFKKLDGNQKASCLTTTEAKQNLSNDYICVASRGRNPENPKSRQPGLETEQMLEPRYDGKTNCLTSVQKDNLVFAADYRSDEGIRIRENGKAPTLTSGSKKSGTQLNSLAIIDYKIIRLTPIECCRLQTVPDSYFFDNGVPIVSETQLYRMLGNGWTVKVIEHILKYLK